MVLMLQVTLPRPCAQRPIIRLALAQLDKADNIERVLGICAALPVTVDSMLAKVILKPWEPSQAQKLALPVHS